MKILTAPKPLWLVDENLKSVFLAGSIEQDKAEQWQGKVIRMLDDKEVQILNPRRDVWDPTWDQSNKHPKFREQVNWELDAMDMADVILVYFDPNTKSPITLLELGLHARSGKIRVCCPDGFWRKGNVEIVCERHGIPMYESLEALVESVAI